jgi:stalled ribosome rescue protein Dom34
LSYRDAAVWIDHQKAHVFRVEAEVFAESIIRAPEHEARHPKREAHVHNHPDDEKRFFADVVHSLSGSGNVLIVGPSTAKLHFRDYVIAHASTVRFSIVGVETVDHPTDKQLAAYVRQYFLVRRGDSERDAPSRRTS